MAMEFDRGSRSGNRWAVHDLDAERVTLYPQDIVSVREHLEGAVELALEVTAEDVVAQDLDVGALLVCAALDAHDHHSERIRMKIRITYQNISATDENSASDAATCCCVS